jgi:hypothetical protein
MACENSFETLPTGAISHIAAMLPVGDWARLAASCRRIRNAISTDAVWRHFFLRDHGFVYAKGLAARPWPHSDHPDGPWHEMALQLWEDTDAVEQMPPRCPPIPHLPAPFAHAFALGKDWRWLYQVHTPLPRSAADETPTRPHACYVDESTIAMFGWNGGGADGYVVRITFGSRKDEILDWTEGMLCVGNNDTVSGWTVLCTADRTVHTTIPNASGTTHMFSFSRSGTRHWVTADASKCGVFASLDVDGTRHYGRCYSADMKTTMSRYPDGTIATKPDVGGRTHGIGETAFANGDILRIGYIDGAPETATFVCSPKCPQARYAGQTLSNCTWRSVAVSVEGSPEQVMVPADNSDDAQLFWSYVADGWIGWPADVTRAALDAIGMSLGALAPSA